MLYWLPKFRNQSPWLLPRPLPGDLQQLAQLAVRQITSVDARSEVTTFAVRGRRRRSGEGWFGGEWSLDHFGKRLSAMGR